MLSDIRAFVESHKRRLRREDESEGVKIYLRDHPYVKRAQRCWWFAGSSFTFSLVGLYAVLSCEFLDRAFPQLDGIWAIEGAALMIAGAISYWNDVYHFGLDRTASSVDRSVAMSLFVSQVGKVFLLGMSLQCSFVAGVLVAVAGLLFLLGNHHFSSVFVVAGRLCPKAQAGSGSPRVEEMVASVSTEMVASTERKRESWSARHAEEEKSSRASSQASTTASSADAEERGETPRRELRKPAPAGDLVGQAGPNARDDDEAKLEQHVRHYLFWHTGWHLVLPIAGLAWIAYIRLEEGASVF